MTLFDRIGTTYNETRRADGRIVEALIRLLGLPPGGIVADIGAGSGNYSCALSERGYEVKAVEPSAAMRGQACDSPNVVWIEGGAENVPLADGSVHGVISTLAIHHFVDLEPAFREMIRIAGVAPVVILTFDPRAGQETWIGEYFPTIWEDAFRVFPPIEEVAGLLSNAGDRQVLIEPFMLPPDIADNFAAAGWRNPHLYLDPRCRANMSPFRLADPRAIAAGIVRLEEDLASGEWVEKYGQTLELPAIDAGYRFIKAEKAAEPRED